MKRDALRRLLAAPIAHRGLHGCGRSGPVENSLGAAEAAIAGGFGIECDVQLSRDGEAFVFHDADLARLTRTAGRLADLDAATLAELTLGAGSEPIPTLSAFLAAVGDGAPLVIEIKSAFDGDMRLTERVVALVAGYAGAVALESFDPAIVRHCRDIRVPCPVGMVGPQEGHGGTADLEECDFVSWSIDDLAAIPARYRLLPRTTWTVRTPAQQALAARDGAQIVFEGFTPATHR